MCLSLIFQPMSEVLDIMDRFTAANIPFIEDYQAMLNIATQECDLEYALNILKTAEEKVRHGKIQYCFIYI